MSAPLGSSVVFWLAPADPQVDPEADPADCAAPWALADDTTDAPGANPDDSADAAAPGPDPRLGRCQPQADHVRHATAGRRWGRRRWRRWRRWRRRWRRRRWWWRWRWWRWRWRRRWWRRRWRWWRRRWWRRRWWWRRWWWRWWWHCRDAAGGVDADVVGVGTGRSAVLDEVAEAVATARRGRHAADRHRVLRPHVRVVGVRVVGVDVEQQRREDADARGRGADVGAVARRARAHLQAVRELVRGSLDRLPRPEHELGSVLQGDDRRQQPVADRARAGRVVEVGADVGVGGARVRREDRRVALEPGVRAQRLAVVLPEPARQVGDVVEALVAASWWWRWRRWRRWWWRRRWWPPSA